MALKVRDPSNKAKTVEVNASNSGAVDEVEELKKKLYTDSVLGCNNRAKYEKDIKSYSGVATLFSVDANNLKYINDTFSHEAGDFLLSVVAKAGMKVWSNHFYRSGGDEFLVYIPDVAQSNDDCDAQTKAFKDELVELNKEKPELPVSAAVGFAYTSSGVDLKALLEEADQAMYEDKRAYKESHPEYDMRRAKVTIDTVKQAIEDGTFHEYVEQMRTEKGEEPKPKPVVEEIDEGFDAVEEDVAEDMKDMWKCSGVEIDESVDSIAEDELPVPVKRPLSSVPEVYEDLSAAHEEEAYREEEFSKKVNPILHETTKKAVAEAVRAENDKVKLEISEVLQDEVSYRLGKYEKRRKRRDLKEKIGFCIKGVVLILIFLIIFGNKQIRMRISIVAKDAGEIISDLLQGKDTSSNKLVEDLFKDWGNDINKVNIIDTTKDKGFDINSEEGAESNE